MMYYLLRHEGVFVGPSAALNVAGAVRVAKTLPPGSTVVTILCDHGDRYLVQRVQREVAGGILWCPAAHVGVLKRHVLRVVLQLKGLEPGQDLSSLDFLASGV